MIRTTRPTYSEAPLRRALRYGHAPLRYALRYGEAPLRRALRYGEAPADVSALPEDTQTRLRAYFAVQQLQTWMAADGVWVGPIEGVWDAYVDIAFKNWICNQVVCEDRFTQCPEIDPEEWWNLDSLLYTTCRDSIDQGGPKVGTDWKVTLKDGQPFVASEALQLAWMRYHNREQQGPLTDSEWIALGYTRGADGSWVAPGLQPSPDPTVEPDEEENEGEPRSVPGGGGSSPPGPSSSSWWTTARTWWVIGGSLAVAAAAVGTVAYLSKRQRAAVPVVQTAPQLSPQLVPELLPAPRPRRPRRRRTSKSARRSSSRRKR